VEAGNTSDEMPNLETMGESERLHPEITFDESTCEVEVLELAGSFQSEGSTEGTEVSSDLTSATAVKEEERLFFQKARDCLAPGALFRYIIHFYTERKIVIFFWIHFATTLIIWFHFGLIKWEQQKEIVPEGAPRYWWKRIAPPLEFGRYVPEFCLGSVLLGRIS
jgi:hypothetical protein